MKLKQPAKRKLRPSIENDELAPLFRKTAKKKPRFKRIMKRRLKPLREAEFAPVAIPLKADEPADIADLLRRAAAELVKFHQIDKKRSITRAEAMKACITASRDLRMEADAADPDHEDPAWLTDRVPHAEMMAFLDDYLERH